MKSYKETRSTSTKPISGRKRIVCTKRVLDIDHQKVSRNLQRSMRKMAKDLQVSRMIGRVVKHGLHLKPYKIWRRKLILEAAKKNRLGRTEKILQKMCSASNKVIIWSDKKISTGEPKMNVQNGRILAASSANICPPVRTVFCFQQLAEVMEWIVMASDVSKSSLVFIEEDVMVNTNVHIKMFEEQVLL